VVIGDTWPIEPKTTPPSCWPIRDADALASAIVAGHLDDALDAVIDAVNLRTHAIARHRRDAALARLAVGDRVRFTNTAKPQYLRGSTGEIHEFYEDLVVVCLDVPVGKFKSGHVRASPELLERLMET
jgi:hypothetical protein